MVVLGRKHTDKTRVWDSVWDLSHSLFLHLVRYVFKGMERCDGVTILWYRELVELVKKVLCDHLVFGGSYHFPRNSRIILDNLHRYRIALSSSL